MRARNFLLASSVALALVAAFATKTKHAGADAVDPDKNARCANRLSISLLGEGASADVAAMAEPRSAMASMLSNPKFIERFSGFVNSQFNAQPGATPDQDAPYYLAKYVLQNAKPWSDMFLGEYDLVKTNPQQANSEVTVQPSPNGLGYFRTRGWMVRYAGNEPAGLRLPAAFRILQNTTGLELIPTTNAIGADLSATGRKAPACAGCHYESWYALDKVAAVLSTRTGQMNNIQFRPPAAGAKEVLGGIMVNDDKELVTALVGNDAFAVNACRLATRFLYGRRESTCEGPLFDKCVARFKETKTIQSALTTFVEDPSFCE
ncbi:MAG: hypothetical protein U0169_08560 [Polyangiaceae bacterium]